MLAIELLAVEGLIGEFRELTQGLDEVRDLWRAGRVGRLLEDQQQPRPTCQVALNRQGFSHREADGKSLLDEVLRRGRGERWGRVGMMDGLGLADGNDGTP